MGKIHKTYNFHHLARISCLSLFLILTLLILYPTTSSAHADTDVSASARIGVRSTTAISLYLASDSANISLSPLATGNFGLTSLKLGVRTNSESGYHVMMSMASDTTALVSSNQSKTNQISSITTDATASNFANNTWGYAISEQPADDNTVYKALPSASGAEISNKSTSTPGNDDECHLSFGVKIDDTLPAGDYSNTVIVSVVANPTVISTLDDMTYMQDMTPTACTNTQEHTQRQLYDLRDGKKYWVAKLADDNCWMVQNLAFDLVEGQTLTADLTDLINTESKAWTVPKTTKTEVTTGDLNSYTSTESTNLGEIILTNPTKSKMCPSQAEDNSYMTVLAGQSLTANCPEYYKDVSGWTDNYTATATQSFDENSHGYDAHYLIGNYYQFNTATAGTAIGSTSPSSAITNPNDFANAPGSICPKGWTLPKASRYLDTAQPNYNQSVDVNGSFYGLISKYGFNQWKGNGQPDISLSGVSANLGASPFYFVRSGNISYTNSGFLSYGGFMANLWSSTLTPEPTDAYRMLFDIYNIQPTNSTNRAAAYPIRCIAR